jgi:acyl-CoA synthetase (AMP-forming)/AMP-acid ligase II
VIIAALATHRVTHAFFVPAVIQSIISAPEVGSADLSALQRVVYGASPMSDAVLLRSMAVLGCDFSHAYGMTETAGTVVTLPPSDHDPGGPRSHLLRSCGKPFPWVELALVEPTSATPVPQGEVGEVWLRSPMVMPGYWGKPAETAEAIVDGGWLRSGDAAYQDAEGYLYLHDRYKDMIVSGAENVYPAEVENILGDHPRVAEVAVIGAPDERWGETVKAIVVPVGDATVTAEELIAHARERLAHYKCPTSVDFVEALPRSAAGKVLKRNLREPHWQHVDRRIS